MDTPTVIVPARTYEKIEEAIRLHHLTYIDEPTATAGLQNLVVWPYPCHSEGIILIRGES